MNVRDFDFILYFMHYPVVAALRFDKDNIYISQAEICNFMIGIIYHL